MYNASLFDGCFGHQLASTLGGDNVLEAPGLVKWSRNDAVYNSLQSAFLTDMHLDMVNTIPDHVRRIAWLIEPPSLSTTHYKKAVMYERYFDHILTFDKNYLVSDKWMYYPFGGSWIHPKEWGFHKKTRMVSLIASNKHGAVGHAMRHKAAKLRDVFPIDVMGYGYAQIASKVTGLNPYRYSIVTESVMCDDYFSEKIIDCFSLFTIPIYWGTHNIDKYFNADGIIAFDTIDELVNILVNTVSEDDYFNRTNAMIDNNKRAMKYRCAEDWIAENYPFLFEAK